MIFLSKLLLYNYPGSNCKDSKYLQIINPNIEISSIHLRQNKINGRMRLMTDASATRKFAIFIIAYQAAQTLISAYRRIPQTLKRKAKEIYCFDDCSDDNTYYAGLGYKTANQIKNFILYKNPKNLGYGGNQKKGYRYAIKKNFDIVVMLHGDAQYAPEKIPLLLEPFYSSAWEKIGMVMGSRMLGDPLKGKMPLYKYIGNKVLTFLENLLLGSNLSEFHSGYRAYNIQALKHIPFERCSNNFHFDTEIIIMLMEAGYKIIEVPIPTYYGPGSKSHVNVFNYGLKCLSSVIEYRLNQLGLKKDSKYDFKATTLVYEFKEDPQSSHNKIAKWVKQLKISKILDVGCAGGFLSKALGHEWKGELIGIEKDLTWSTSKNLIRYRKVFWGDLEKKGVKEMVGKENQNFEAVIFADILEHLNKPEKILNDVKKILKPGGYLIVSLPNTNYLPILIIRLIFPKFRMFKGPLDKTHKHFYNLNNAKKILNKNNFTIKDMQATPPPLALFRVIYNINHFLAVFLPNLFAYQLLFLTKLNEKSE